MRRPDDLLLAQRHLRVADPSIGRVIESIGRCRLHDTPPDRPLPALMRTVISQQLSTNAAATIWRRFLQLYRHRPPPPARLQATSDRLLRGAGLSRQKVACLRDLAARVEDGSLPLGRLSSLADQEVVELLTRIHGIGEWTAQIFLMFQLQRLDVLPAADLGLQDAVWQLRGLGQRPGAGRLVQIAEPWRPYRSVASWYLWRYRRAAGTRQAV